MRKTESRWKVGEKVEEDAENEKSTPKKQENTRYLHQITSPPMISFVRCSNEFAKNITIGDNDAIKMPPCKITVLLNLREVTRIGGVEWSGKLRKYWDYNEIKGCCKQNLQNPLKTPGKGAGDGGGGSGGRIETENIKPGINTGITIQIQRNWFLIAKETKRKIPLNPPKKQKKTSERKPFHK